LEEDKMVAEAEVVCQQSVDVLDVKYFPNKGSNIHEIGDGDVISPSNFEKVRVSESVSAELLTSKEVSFFFIPLLMISCFYLNFVLLDEIDANWV
jgi:hypothetical protein